MAQGDRTAATAKKRIGWVIAVLILVGALFRLYCNSGTLHQYYTDNVFRVGLIPWSDARGWVDGALSIMSGEPLDGYPAYRPLTPLFLAGVFSLTGVDYLRGMFAQGALLLLALAAAAWILRKVRPRLAVWIFLALSCIWRPQLETSFITEIPGILVLLPGFALLWRGTVNASRRDTMAGIFLFGLNQAIRPWNIFSLALLPLLAFHGRESWRRRCGLFLAYTACAAAGFGFHPLAATLFNTPGAVGGNEDKALYGRVSGGSWMLYYYDQEITKARNDKKIDARELRRITYRRCWEIFREQPRLFLISIRDSYWNFFKKLPLEFGSGLLTGACFLLSLLLIKAAETGSGWKGIRTWGWRRQLPVFISFSLLVAAYSWTMVLLALTGIFLLWRERRSRLAWFTALYLAGMLLSIPLVGDDGATRIKIAGDIVLFLLASGGLAFWWDANRHDWRFSSRDDDERPFSFRDIYPAAAYAVGAFLLLIAIPGAIKASALPASERHWDAVSALRQQLPPGQQLLTPEDLDRIWNEFPQPSFEKYNGAWTACMTDLRLRDIIHAPGGDGLRKTSNIMQFWPLAPLPEPRSIIVRESRMAILCGISLEQLRHLEGKRVILLGRLITNPRGYLFATGYVLDVARIGIRTDNGAIAWISVKK